MCSSSSAKLISNFLTADADFADDLLPLHQQQSVLVNSDLLQTVTLERFIINLPTYVASLIGSGAENGIGEWFCCSVKTTRIIIIIHIWTPHPTRWSAGKSPEIDNCEQKHTRIEINIIKGKEEICIFYWRCIDFVRWPQLPPLRPGSIILCRTIDKHNGTVTHTNGLSICMIDGANLLYVIMSVGRSMCIALATVGRSARLMMGHGNHLIGRIARWDNSQQTHPEEE